MTYEPPSASGVVTDPDTTDRALASTRALARGNVRWRPSRRQVAITLWAMVVVVMTVRWGVPTGRANLFIILGLGLIAFGAGNHRNVVRVLRALHLPECPTESNRESAALRAMEYRPAVGGQLRWNRIQR